ncbi:hypothetical protein ACFY89_02700 [Achromobacter spanius]|uniref:hypothetical protein n=1 Tax=Achromobacter spanius TaxID=217203 RepID=UPI0036E3A08A
MLRNARNPSSSGGVLNASSHNATSARWVTRDLHSIFLDGVSRFTHPTMLAQGVRGQAAMSYARMLRNARNPSCSGGVLNASSHNATFARWVTRDLHSIFLDGVSRFTHPTILAQGVRGQAAMSYARMLRLARNPVGWVKRENP